MIDTKAVFLADKELSDWLRAIVNDNRFKAALAFASSAMMSNEGVTGEHIAGARRFQQTLVDLPALPELFQGAFPRSGLSHDLDPKPRLKQESDTTPKQHENPT